jgi:hypothetical protein
MMNILSYEVSTERGQGQVEAHVQGVAGDLQVAGEGEPFPKERAGFVVAAGVVRA